MKYLVTILMIAIVGLLGCVKAPKTDLEATLTEDEISENIGETLTYTPGTWIENWDLAVGLAQDQDKAILVNFTGSDWCIWCKRLVSEVFDKPEFIEYAGENLILLKLDFPRSIPQSQDLINQNRQLQAQFRIQGYPTILLVDKEGKEFGRTGYQQGGPVKYVEHLQGFFK